MGHRTTQDLIEGITIYSTYGLFDLFNTASIFLCKQINSRKYLFTSQYFITEENKQVSKKTLSHCCFSELFPLVLQFPSVKAVLLSLETFPFVLGPGGSISVPGRKGQKVWIVKNGKYCSTPTLPYSM